ncbi:MAG: hypothetical protein KDA93_27165 [Planctomycetaceae bacterium]|nr:hypothetical protein [Planctomycetaceae bacterium]
MTDFECAVDRRQLIWGSLLMSGLLIVLSVLGLAMSVLLASLGDEFGGKIALVSALTTGVGWLITHIFLVSLLALAALERNMEG